MVFKYRVQGSNKPSVMCYVARFRQQFLLRYVLRCYRTHRYSTYHLDAACPFSHHRYVNDVCSGAHTVLDVVSTLPAAVSFKSHSHFPPLRFPLSPSFDTYVHGLTRAIPYFGGWSSTQSRDYAHTELYLYRGVRVLGGGIEAWAKTQSLRWIPRTTKGGREGASRPVVARRMSGWMSDMACATLAEEGDSAG
jgi:hypothetical protein